MTSQTYVYTISTPGYNNFIMPAGFSNSVEVYLWGAGGADGRNGHGGGGGYSYAKIPVNPGDVVGIGVGTAGNGRNGGDNGFTHLFFGGYAGGSYDVNYDTGNAGGGGGATAILVNDVLYAVAAGGGGGGGGGLQSAGTNTVYDGYPGGLWNALNTEVNGGNGTDGQTGGAGGGAGYPLGGNGTSGTTTDLYGSYGGSGGQNFGDFTEPGSGIHAGGQSSLYKPTANYGDANQSGYAVLVFQRSYTLYNKIANKWKNINNAWVNINGQWKNINAVWTKVNNTWKPILSTNSITAINTRLSPSPASAPTVQSAGYTISSNIASVDEGSSVLFTINTTNILDNTTLYWNSIGSGANVSRFVDNTISGNFKITNNVGTITRSIVANNLTDGVTSFSLNILTGSPSGNTVITSSPVIINDTSRTPSYSIVSNVSGCNEGDTVQFNISTTNVPDKTTLYWTAQGTAANTYRFTDSKLSGSTTISSNTSTIWRRLALDTLTDGPTSFLINLYTDSTTNVLVASSGLVSVVDTSQTPVGYNITPSSYRVNEGSTVTFSISTLNISNGTTLYWDTSGSAASSNRFADGQTSGSFQVYNNASTLLRELANNTLTDGPTSFQINLRTGSVSGPIVATSAIVNINDTSLTPATYSLTASSTSVNEGGTVFFTLHTTNVPDGTVLSWNTNGSAATASRFYDNTLIGTVTIAGGTASITRKLVEDHLTEGSTSFILSISLNGGINVANSPTVTVNDTSTAPIIPTYNISANSYSINEGDTVTFTVNTTNVADNTTLYWTTIGTAAANSYSYNTTTMAKTAASRFTNGAITGTIVIVNGQAILPKTLSLNNYTDGVTSFAIQIRTGSVTGMIVATSGTVTVNDTSTTPDVSYSITPNKTVINETTDPTVIFNIKTTGVANGTKLIATATLDAQRFTDNINSGPITIYSQGASISRTIATDYITDGDTGFSVRLFDTSGSQVAESSFITVLDTSRTLPGSKTWTSPGTYSWTVPIGVTSVQYLVVGGGGSGGSAHEVGAGGGGGGGGSGGVRFGTANVNPGEVYTIIIGAGGAPSAAGGRGGVSPGHNGEASSLSGAFGTLVATGGGAGTGGDNWYGGLGGAGGSLNGVNGSNGQAGWNDSASPAGGAGGQLNFNSIGVGSLVLPLVLPITPGRGSNGANAIDRTSPLYWNSSAGTPGGVFIAWAGG